ncbi:MAG TPA: hypothetical protein P5031_08770, partial [Candidatus Syntrophosphaera sp.]|nr:hypothetical protein [Candidatus Syntrophosphaera sp.]
QVRGKQAQSLSTSGFTAMRHCKVLACSILKQTPAPCGAGHYTCLTAILSSSLAWRHYRLVRNGPLDLNQ